MLSPETKDWIHTGIEVATALGIWTRAWTWGKRGKKIAEAMSQSPEMLHEHTEAPGEPLTQAGVHRPFAAG